MNGKILPGQVRTELVTAPFDWPKFIVTFQVGPGGAELPEDFDFNVR